VKLQLETHDSFQALKDFINADHGSCLEAVQVLCLKHINIDQEFLQHFKMMKTLEIHSKSQEKQVYNLSQCSNLKRIHYQCDDDGGDADG